MPRTIDFTEYSYDHGNMKQVRNINNLGRVIKKQRHQLNLSQTQLAHLAGVSLNLISQVELGKPRVQFIKILQVLQALGLQLKVELGSAGLLIEKRLLDEN